MYESPNSPVTRDQRRPESITTHARYVVLWTILIEAFTCLMRFGLRLESTRDTASTIGRLTFGVRIHHSYIGVLLLPIALLVECRWPTLSRVLLVAGLSLLTSDLIHHFIVLWLITGSPQFDLLY